MKWENSTNERVLEAARFEIQRSTGGVEPHVLDPFCGGGSIPLEAQRLGLVAEASDLNPVAVLITKALVELPARFAHMSPVNPADRQQSLPGTWQAAHGLAADIRYYGKWMRDMALSRLGHLYPPVKLPPDYGGGEAQVIAWLWARVVECPNPACKGMAPLAATFWLYKKKGHETWVEPQIDRGSRRVKFNVRHGPPGPRAGSVNSKGASCIICGSPIPFAHVRSEGRAGRLGVQLMAVVTEAGRRRTYLAPSADQEQVADAFDPKWEPETSLPDQALGFRVQLYGLTKHRDLFTRRQLATLGEFSSLALEARARVLDDALAAGRSNDDVPLNEGGKGARAYADAVATYLGLTVSKVARFSTVLSFWRPDEGKLSRAFGRQTVSMTWDFAETNPFSSTGGDLLGLVDGTAAAVERTCPVAAGTVVQADASQSLPFGKALVCTDPPYYDNVAYADLSDIFYVWQRHSLTSVCPSLFATVLTPKSTELVADPFKFGGDRGKAQAFFEEGLRRAFTNVAHLQDPRFPCTVFYAFKQSEKDTDEHGVQAVASTGWETVLQSLLNSGFELTGTWPIRTEGPTRMRGIASNALASSIVLVCRPRSANAARTTRREFVNTLRSELPEAIRKLEQGNIAPVDLAQAAIGPGMSVFSRFTEVLEPDGRPMTVRTALQLINQALDEVLKEQEGDYDADTRWALAWFEQHGTEEGQYGEAEVLSKAKDTAVEALREAAVVKAGAGKVTLLSRSDMSPEWDPQTDRRLSHWKATQHLIRALEQGGDGQAADLVARLPGETVERVRDLAYRLYTISERKGWAQEAGAYNTLVIAWPEIMRLAADRPVVATQAPLL